jgi:AcrR family transcriptional regulator
MLIGRETHWPLDRLVVISKCLLVALGTSAESPVPRIVRAASRCFASKGYAGTTITDIELDAGYSPRAGGIYRHFPSKRAILEAVIDAAVAGNEAMIDEMRSSAAPSSVTMPPEHIAELIVRRALAELDRQAELFLIVFRDLDQFPDLLAKVRDGLANATIALARGLAASNPALDAEALAVVAVGPTIDFKIKQHMLGFTPLGISEERFIAAWVKIFTPLYAGAL